MTQESHSLVRPPIEAIPTRKSNVTPSPLTYNTYRNTTSSSHVLLPNHPESNPENHPCVPCVDSPPSSLYERFELAA
jgi:hypothetical protein